MKTILEIIALCMRIDSETQYAAFFSYSGHVEKLSVEITFSKIEYNNILYQRDWIQNEEERQEVITKLKTFLP